MFGLIFEHMSGHFELFNISVVHNHICKVLPHDALDFGKFGLDYLEPVESALSQLFQGIP
jgi:hypothetical protein